MIQFFSKFKNHSFGTIFSLKTPYYSSFEVITAVNPRLIFLEARLSASYRIILDFSSEN